MACVGTVYTMEPFRRTADEVVDEVLRDQCQPERPVPKHKRMRVELTRAIDGDEVDGKERVFSWFAEQVGARNPGGDKPVVCVVDGERALWKLLMKHLP